MVAAEEHKKNTRVISGPMQDNAPSRRGLTLFGGLGIINIPPYKLIIFIDPKLVSQVLQNMLFSSFLKTRANLEEERGSLVQVSLH